MLFLTLIIEAMPFWKAAIYMGLSMIVIFAMIGAGSYIFIRLLAHFINSRRDSWVDTGTSLGLSPDPSKGVMLKSLTGKRGEHIVNVEPYAVPTGRYSSDAYAAVEVLFQTPLDFSLTISKPEMLYQKVAGLFDSSEVELGMGAFDKAFKVNCSHPRSLHELLTFEMLDGQSPTLLTDLMHANKKYHRIKITDRSVCLGVRAELDDVSAVEGTIEKTIYLADRVAEARRRIAE